jgi:hypothetical protein
MRVLVQISKAVGMAFFVWAADFPHTDSTQKYVPERRETTRRQLIGEHVATAYA